MVSVSVPEHYGFVCLMLVASLLISVYLGIKVGMARKQYKVEYPTMYAIASVHGEKEAKMFNCVQRGHQNFLENLLTFVVLSVLSGLFSPLFTAACQAVYLVGRILYAAGYATGDPKKRSQGMIMYLGLIPMLVCSVMFAVPLL